MDQLKVVTRAIFKTRQLRPSADGVRHFKKRARRLVDLPFSASSLLSSSFTRREELGEWLLALLTLISSPRLNSARSLLFARRGQAEACGGVVPEFRWCETSSFCLRRQIAARSAAPETVGRVSFKLIMEKNERQEVE